jgi:hypothetical protein
MNFKKILEFKLYKLPIYLKVLFLLLFALLLITFCGLVCYISEYLGCDLTNDF